MPAAEEAVSNMCLVHISICLQDRAAAGEDMTHHKQALKYTEPGPPVLRGTSTHTDVV